MPRARVAPPAAAAAAAAPTPAAEAEHAACGLLALPAELLALVLRLVDRDGCALLPAACACKLLLQLMLQEGKAARLRFPEKTGVKAASRGDSKVLFLALECYAKGLPSSQRGPSLFVNSCAEAASAAGHLAVLQAMLAQGYDEFTQSGWSLCFVVAAGAGHLDVLQYLQRWSDARTCPNACVSAAAGGHVFAFRQLRAWGHVSRQRAPTGSERDEYARCMMAAARGGQYGMLLFLRHVCDACLSVNVCAEAAEGGHLELLERMHNRWGHCDSYKCATAAARNGHPHVLKWLVQIGCRLDERICTFAASGGSIAVMQWLREQRVPCTSDCYTEAIGQGDVPMLQWLFEHGCPLAGALHWEEAVVLGHARVLPWLRERGIPMRDGLMRLAVLHGKTDMIGWFVQNGGAVDCASALL